jgi:2-polyprenyl-6-methoxyphenol hydroxylase-like FAD-dependent oxidoreductase
VERDALDQGAEPRRGVPQGRHLHGLLKRGEQIMSSLFPDFVRALLARGATPIEFGRDLRWYHFGCWKQNYESGLVVLSVTRPTLEDEIRRRVREIPNIRVLDHSVVTNYLADAERSRVTGVCVRGRDADAPSDEIRADLVIDAGGRGSQTPRHLAALGFARPPEQHVTAEVAYATRLFEQMPGARSWKALVVMDQPPASRGGLLFPIEDNRWMVTLIGRHGDKPPLDEAGFIEFAKSLPMPDLYLAISGARGASKIVPHGFPSSQRRYYERMDRFPSRLIVMGDALCSFNPVFAQGMSVSAMQAELLRTCFDELRSADDETLDAVTEKFRKSAADVVDGAWQMTTGEDLRFPQTVGPRPLKLRFMHWYTERLHRAAGRSKLVAERFYRVMNMVASPATLFGRDVLAELLRTAYQAPRTAEGTLSEPMPYRQARSPSQSSSRRSVFSDR